MSFNVQREFIPFEETLDQLSAQLTRERDNMHCIVYNSAARWNTSPAIKKFFRAMQQQQRTPMWLMMKFVGALYAT